VPFWQKSFFTSSNISVAEHKNKDYEWLILMNRDCQMYADHLRLTSIITNRLLNCHPRLDRGSNSAVIRTIQLA
jgi:hypothetical protein